MADNTALRNFAGTSETMRTTDRAGVKIPHHYIDDVALTSNLSAPAVSNLVLSAVAASLVALTTVSLAGTLWIFIFDAVTMPANGARTPIIVPFPVTVNQWLRYDFLKPLKCATGIVVAASSTLNTGGAWNFTSSANAIFSGQIAAATGEAL